MPERSSADKPFPGPVVAIALTAVAWGTFHYWFQLAQGWLDVITALALSLSIAYGLVGALALPQVPPPRPGRLGLRAPAPITLLHAVLLMPALFVGLELQALVRLFAGRAGGVGVWVWNRELVVADSVWVQTEIVLLVVILYPVLTEWFFRGLVLQGLVSRLGRARGLLMASALSALPQAVPRDDPWVWIAVVLSAVWWGFVAGVLRITSGSLVPSILLHAGWNALWLFFVMRTESMPVPAFTVFGASLPPLLILPAVLCVAAGAVLQWRSWRRA